MGLPGRGCSLHALTRVDCPTKIQEVHPTTSESHLETTAEIALPRSASLGEVDTTQDWQRIGRHLETEGLALDPRFAPRRFVGGLANLNFLLRLGTGEWAVLRRPPSGPLPPGANDMAREHRILQRLWRALPTAPRSFHFCADASIAGAPFQLLEFRAGLTVRGDSLGNLPDQVATGRALSRLLVEGLASIHAIDPAEVGLAELGRPDGFMARTARGWTERAARACGPQLSPTLRSLADWLERHCAGLSGEVTLLHNDFKLDNLVLDPRTLELAAVLDWDMGTRGDALFDLASMLSYWTEPGDPECMHRLAQMPTARTGFLTREQVAQAYAHSTGGTLDDFKAYRVLGMFKLGVVFHQLHARFRSGEVTDPRYAPFGDLADELLHFAHLVVQDRIF